MTKGCLCNSLSYNNTPIGFKFDFKLNELTNEHYRPS